MKKMKSLMTVIFVIAFTASVTACGFTLDTSTDVAVSNFEI